MLATTTERFVKHQISRLEKQLEAGSISKEKNFDQKHGLYLFLRVQTEKELPDTHLAHENAKMTFGDTVLYTDQLTEKMYSLDSKSDRVYITPEEFSFLKDTFAYSTCERESAVL